MQQHLLLSTGVMAELRVLPEGMVLGTQPNEC